MPKPIPLETPCEVCGKNEWWDNRDSKKSKKAPDYACANKECAGKDGYKVGRWVKAAKDEPKGGRLTGDDTTPQEKAAAAGYSWANLTHTYSKLMGAVVGAMKAHDVPLDPSAIQAGVATLLIQGEKMHLGLLKAKVEKVTVAQVLPKPEPKPKAESFAELPEALEGDDDDLPW